MRNLLCIIVFLLVGVAINAQSTSVVMKAQVKIISGAKVTMIANSAQGQAVDNIVISASPNVEVMVKTTNFENVGEKNVALISKHIVKSDLVSGIHTISLNSLGNEATSQNKSSKKLATTINYL